jgi:hypothetical protein
MTITIHLTAQDGLAAMLAQMRASAAETGAAEDSNGSGASTARNGRVLFVVDSHAALTAVDLKVLRREAVACGVGQVALVTSDVKLRALAAREGISTFRRQAHAERARWHTFGRRDRVGRQFRATGPAGVAAPYGAGLFSKRSPTGFRPAAFLRSFARGASSWWGALGMILVLIALLGGLLVAFATVIPTAIITLTPSSERIQVTVPLRAVQDAVPDAEAGIVPARALSSQVSGKARIPTTGRRLEPEAKARGDVVLINRTAVPVTVPSGTVVTTATGNNVRFATTADAPLAPNGRATVPVEAVLPGPTGNVRAGTITRLEGPQALTILVANEAAMSGGTTAQMGVVTEEDKAQLQALLFDELKQQAYEQMNQGLGTGSFVPAETVSYLPLSPTFTPFVGEVSPDLFLDMSVQAVGLLVDSNAGATVALARLQEAMPPGTRLISDTLRFIPGSVRVVDPRTVEFSITAEGTLLRGIDAQSVRTSVLGMTPERAAAVLGERFDLADPPQIRLGPDWLPYIVPTNVPVLSWRIRVDVDWDTAAQLAAKR